MSPSHDLAWESKCFEFAREISRYHELADLEEERIVPQFILVGDQSSGKTTLLCRLAGMPLGFTTNGTGTRRPFEYNLIKDPDQVEPLITVDSEQVSEMSLLSKLTQMNGTAQDGFRNQAVSVKIVWKDIATNMMIVDMPGMKDGESGPEDMVLERLKQANVIPVVVLEPRDMGSAHYVYKVLEKARPRRDCSSIVAIVNKCDEKMEGAGEWVDESCFRGWWQGAMNKRFRAIFCVGWPRCASRNSDSPQQQRRQLAESITAEVELIEEWERKLGDKLPDGVSGSMGIAKFQQYLNRDQAARLRELVAAIGPKVDRDHRQAKLAALEQNSVKRLKKKLSDLMHTWSDGVQDFVDGRFDFNAFKESCMTADEDAKWLHEESTKFLWSLCNREEYQPVKTQELLDSLDSKLKGNTPPVVARSDPALDSSRSSKELISISTESGSQASESIQEKGSWVSTLQPWIPSVSVGLLGKAAFERDIELVVQFALFRVLDHILTEFTEDFVRNIRACPSEDSGSKVVLLFVGRVMSETLHPLVDVLSMLIQMHLDACIKAPFKRFIGCEDLKEMDLAAEFDDAAADFVQQLISDFNVQLHNRLKEQCFRLQGRSRSTPEGHALASLMAGMAPEGEAQEEAGGFDAQARAFLEMSLETLKQSGPVFEPAAELYKTLLDCAVEPPASPALSPEKASAPAAQKKRGLFGGNDDAGTGSQGNEGLHESTQPDKHPEARAFLDDLKDRFQIVPNTKWAGMSMRALHRHAGYELVAQVIGFRDLLEQKVESLKQELQKKLASEMAWQVGNTALKKLSRENKKHLKFTRRVLQVLERARSLRRELMGESSDSDLSEESS